MTDVSPSASCRARHKVTMGRMNESGQVSGKGLQKVGPPLGLVTRTLWTTLPTVGFAFKPAPPAPPLVPGAGLIAEQFLETTAAQLTYHGLCELTAAAREGELSVFFRNNHFSTMTKHKVRTQWTWGLWCCLFPRAFSFRVNVSVRMGQTKLGERVAPNSPCGSPHPGVFFIHAAHPLQTGHRSVPHHPWDSG